MKVEHRAKALEAYNGARVVLKEGLVYPSYVLLKEASRAMLAYIAEDKMDKDFSEKTKLKNLMELMTEDLVPSNHMEKLQVILDAEQSGLSTILQIDLNELKDIKSSLKQLIGMYLSEHV